MWSSYAQNKCHTHMHTQYIYITEMRTLRRAIGSLGDTQSCCSWSLTLHPPHITNLMNSTKLLIQVSAPLSLHRFRGYSSRKWQNSWDVKLNCGFERLLCTASSILCPWHFSWPCIPGIATVQWCMWWRHLYEFPFLVKLILRYSWYHKISHGRCTF